MPSDSWSANGSYVTSYVGTLSVSQVSQDIETNKTKCHASLLLDNNSYNYFRGFAVTGSFSCDGSMLNSVSFSGYMEPNGAAQYHSLYLFQDFEFEVEHDANGAKTISVSATITTGTSVINGSKVGAGQINITGGTLTLDTIPRASSLTAPSIELEQTGTLTITRQDASFKDTISWECLSESGTISYVPSGLSQTVSFDTSTIASDIYPLIPDTTSAEITYTINTYLSDGTTLIGTKEVKSTLTMGDSIVPSFVLNAGSYTWESDNAWIESLPFPVSGFTKISSNIAWAYFPGTGANPGNATYSIDGQTGTVPATDIDGWETPNPVNATGLVPLTVVASDSRGRTTTKSTNIQFRDYSAPAITSFKAIRGTYSGGSWTSDPTGPHIRVKFNATVSFSSYGNTGETVVIGCTGKPNQTLTNVTSGTVYFDNTDEVTEYTITLAFTDKAGTTTNRNVKVLSAAADFNFNTNLPALGLGRLATRAKMVESAWDVEVEKASGEAYYSVKNNNGEARLRMSTAGVGGVYNEGLSKWVVYDDASGHTNIPDLILPITGNSTASITLSSDSGNVTYSSSASATTVNIPTGTPTGWFAVVIRARASGNMTLTCGGSDQMYVKGQTGLVTSYAVPGYTTVFLFRTSATRLALMIGG